MLFNGLEKIEKTLYPLGNGISLRVVVNTARKGNENVRLSADYLNKGKTSKYSNVSETQFSTLNTQDYGSFTKYVRGESPVELYFSYPHLAGLLSGFVNAAKEMRSKENTIFFTDPEDGNLYFNADYENLKYSIGPLINDKRIIIIPHVILADTDSKGEAGVLVMFGEENVNTTMTLYQLESFVFYLKNEFSLSNIASSLTIFAGLQMLNQNGGTGSGSNTNSTEQAPTVNTDFRSRMRKKRNSNPETVDTSAVLDDNTDESSEEISENDISNIFDEVKTKVEEDKKEEISIIEDVVTQEPEETKSDENDIVEDKVESISDEVTEDENTKSKPVNSPLFSKELLQSKANDMSVESLFDD